MAENFAPLAGVMVVFVRSVDIVIRTEKNRILHIKPNTSWITNGLKNNDNCYLWHKQL